jgi:hypothetical protein
MLVENGLGAGMPSSGLAIKLSSYHVAVVSLADF